MLASPPMQEAAGACARIGEIDGRSLSGEPQARTGATPDAARCYRPSERPFFDLAHIRRPPTNARPRWPSPTPVTRPGPILTAGPLAQADSACPRRSPAAAVAVSVAVTSRCQQFAVALLVWSAAAVASELPLPLPLRLLRPQCLRRPRIPAHAVS